MIPLHNGRIIDLATNCYGYCVLQKTLDYEEEVCLLIMSELLRGDPATTLVNKHASHVWSKSLKGKWAALAYYETGSLVITPSRTSRRAKNGIVDELLGQGAAVCDKVAKSQWGSYCIQPILEHGSEKHRQMAPEHLLTGLLEFATNEQGSKGSTASCSACAGRRRGRCPSFLPLLLETDPSLSARCTMIVDLALSLTGSQLIASVLPTFHFANLFL
ncbi:hypothetical protein K438DRAFT_1986420 [Mycena galopus ATCC 62051]|nr:hypothetical protein K438DRAFT_1986420 [Mycena galopus ATCC 62051]